MWAILATFQAIDTAAASWPYSVALVLLVHHAARLLIEHLLAQPVAGPAVIW